MSIVKLARPEIQGLRAYKAAAQVDDTVRLNANESPVSASVSCFRRPLNRYPEIRPNLLQVELAKRFGCEQEELLITRGSSEAIDLLIRVFCRAGIDNLLTPSPSFEMYNHYALVQGAQHIQVATSAADDFAVDVSALIDACNEHTKLIFVCSPNNPTGTPLPREDLIALLKARRGKSAVVVDEAYIEFGTDESAINLFSEFSNLLVLRTLSKALGFAGARCGAVAGPADVIAMLDAVQAPYALATPVVECVEDALQQAGIAKAEAAIVDVVAERRRVITAIECLSFVDKVWPSSANFFLLRVDDAERVMQYCADRHILLRNFGDKLPGCIRITVGSRDDNDQLLAALNALQESLS